MHAIYVFDINNIIFLFRSSDKDQFYSVREIIF